MTPTEGGFPHNVNMSTIKKEHAIKDTIPMPNNGFSIEEVADAIREARGNLAAASRRLGLTRTAVFQRCKRNKYLREIMVECKEAFKDDAESALQKAVLNGESWAVCFFLKTQAKDRGYVERSEQISKDGERSRQVIIIGPNSRKVLGD